MYNNGITKKTNRKLVGKLIKTASLSALIQPSPSTTYVDIKPVFVPVVA